MRPVTETGYEPIDWLVVFHETCGKPWLDRLIPGRFKHVSAMTWCEIGQVWLFYYPSHRRSQVYVMPKKTGDAWAAQLMAAGTVLRVPVQRNGPARLPRFGFWCSTAIAHLLGIKGGALPMTVYRSCLALVEQEATERNVIRCTRTAGADA